MNRRRGGAVLGRGPPRSRDCRKATFTPSFALLIAVELMAGAARIRDRAGHNRSGCRQASSRGLGHFACWLRPFRIHNTQKKRRNLAKSLVRQCSAQNTPGANQFSRAMSVVFSEFEFVVSTQSDAEPGRELATPLRRRAGLHVNSRDGDKKQLPVVLPPAADELLSSWIARHGAFYNVSPRAMLRYAVPNARSLRAADDHLTDKPGRLLAHIFRRDLFRHSSHDVCQCRELRDAPYRSGGNPDMSNLRGR